MKTIGLIGGTSWVSSHEYCRLINEMTNKKTGGKNFSKCILYSINYSEIEFMRSQNNDEGIFNLICETAGKLSSAGADCVALCANSLHIYANRLESKIDIPLLQIASATAKKIKECGFNKVGLLGTKSTMEMSFYKDKLAESGVRCIIPDIDDRDFIQYVISKELIYSQFKTESRDRFIHIIDKLNKEGAAGVVLGCTEIPMLVKQKDSLIPMFDTLKIHAEALVDFALS